MRQSNEDVRMEVESENDRLKRFFMQAPAGICILDGPGLVFELINPPYQQLFPNRELLGKPLSEAIPEIKSLPIWEILQHVYSTGKTFEGKELLIPLARTDDGPIEDRYFNFIYQARRDDKGVIDGILVFVIEVTDSVQAKHKVERAEESLRMAIDAAKLGSYYINAADRIFVASPRLKEFFGFGPDEEVPYEAAINQIHPDYRQAAADLVEAAFTKGVRFDMEYPVVGYHDGKIRWVRGIGTVQHDSSGKNSYFTGVLHDITQRKQDEIRKNDFIGMVSHELKTPLTSLTGLVQLLQLELKDSKDEFIPNALSRANLLVKKMNNLINGFLNVSLFESGKIFIHKQEFDMVGLIREMIEETGLMASTYTINFSEAEPIAVHADRDKIGSVISNLLGNAVKYSPAGKEIEVTCRRVNDEVTVSVKDQGMGINPNDLDKIFDRFYRVEANNSRHISGFGIGLYLSAEIIKAHEGRIWAESESGQGSAFSFSLP